MMKLMSDYEIVDYLLLDYIESGDTINVAGQDYFVKDINYYPATNDWILHVIDRMEEEIELTLPDGTIAGLCIAD
jgi:hypothetical protein